MNVLRTLAILSFVVGAGLLVVGFVRSGQGTGPATPAPIATFGPTATATSIPPGFITEVPSATPTPEATPAGPPPYDGAVARFEIPRFKVDAPIEAIGLVPGTIQLDTPHDPHDVGWYMQYDKPGFSGNAVFAAHVDYFPDILGPFNRLKDVNEKDEVDITMDNGLVYRYEVFSKNVYSIDDLDMSELIWPTTKPAGDEWITLITCGGQFVPTQASGAGEYLSRVVVIARRLD